MAGIPWHFANLFEQLAEQIPYQTLLVQGDSRLSYTAFEARAARLASAFHLLGTGRDSKIAIYMRNGFEYKEAELAAAKIRAIAVSVNYRFADNELIHLLEDADAEILVFHRCFADRVARVRDRLPQLRGLIIVEDDSNDPDPEAVLRYEDLIANHDPMPPVPRAADDGVLTYTGGTTGLPKGVMFTQETSLRFTTIGYEFYDLPVPDSLDALLSAACTLAERKAAPVSLICAPFMHSIGSTLGFTMTAMMGGTALLLEGASFDAAEALTLAERERATQIVLVGDAIARPLLDELDRAATRGQSYDIGSMRLMASSGVMWSREIKAGLLRYRNMKLIDILGSSEGGMGLSVTTRDSQPATAEFQARPNIKLLSEDGSEMPWGDSRPGLVATTGNIPHGYYKDPERSARTFLEIDGVRYSVPGDYARIDAAGRITMLGRGSACINTGGEKVFAEEVEEVLKRHPDVVDALVIGIPDPRLAAAVAAIVALRDGAALDIGALQDFARTTLAGYKIPRSFFAVPEIRRGPNGKADYRWAADLTRQHIVPA